MFQHDGAWGHQTKRISLITYKNTIALRTSQPAEQPDILGYNPDTTLIHSI
jgi:hypothetical protein